uniref:hypothetical protein n=1 Tax=Nonomuraea sp. CA-251285 TaxID=3240002 RepID=UPI003F49A92E
MSTAPETCLAYCLPHEAWYAAEPQLTKSLHIVCRRVRDSLTVWDLTLIEQSDGTLGLEGTGNSWYQFAEGVRVLAYLTGGQHVSIPAMRIVLDAHGAADETVRTGPYATLAG